MGKELYALIVFAAAFVSSNLWGAIEAESFGFREGADPIENSKALQKAVDCGGEIRVSSPGIYDVGATVFIGDNTSLIFSKGVILRKNAEHGKFCHVFLNKGAHSRTYNKSISIKGLYIDVNGLDYFNPDDILGHRGHVAFFYVKELNITDFTCMGSLKWQFNIQVCTFEDLNIDGVVIRGLKDGIHLGRGKRFRIANAVISTGDDAIALNAHDYDTSNPEVGWIENGIIENVYDLSPEGALIGYDGKKIHALFARIISGTWGEWKEGMEVQKSDIVVSNGKMYRVQMPYDFSGKTFKSATRPTHGDGAKVIDGINWRMFQKDVVYNAGVRNVTFRNIFLSKVRAASFSIHADCDVMSRSFYPGGKFTLQENIVFDNVRVLHDENRPFIISKVPVDNIVLSNCFFKNNCIRFVHTKDVEENAVTHIFMSNVVFNPTIKDFQLIKNDVKDKKIEVIK